MNSMSIILTCLGSCKQAKLPDSWSEFDHQNVVNFMEQCTIKTIMIWMYLWVQSRKWETRINIKLYKLLTKSWNFWNFFAGWLLGFVLLSWLNALYSFDYKWSLSQRTLEQRVHFFELHWAYFAGKLLPLSDSLNTMVASEFQSIGNEPGVDFLALLKEFSQSSQDIQCSSCSRAKIRIINSK